jgi:hypothetical protein
MVRGQKDNFAEGALVSAFLGTVWKGKPNQPLQPRPELRAMIRFLQVIGILLLLLSIALGPAAAAPNLQLQLLLPQNTAQFKYYTMAPGAVAVGPQNASGQQNIYVADAGFDSILKFDANGNLLSQWGGPGTGNGQFGEPRGLAADALGACLCHGLGELLRPEV